MMPMYDQLVPVITLDGPSGTGKGTLCHLLANHLGWHALDSGALYRVLAHAAMKAGVSLQDEAALVKLSEQLAVTFKTDMSLTPQVYLDGECVSAAIREETCGQAASQIAAFGLVREALLGRQRAFAMLPGLVTDGRDMGTVVFPSAYLKIYLDASVEIRANRRYFQLKEKEIDVSLAEVISELRQRDDRDMARSHAPLKPAEDAVVVDTSTLSIPQVFECILQHVESRRSS